MKVLHRKIKRIALSFALVLLAAFSFLLPVVVTANAAETNASIYTSVLDDLQKDETFDVTDYPVIEKDYSLDVIQIAESSDNELFVYVYQPSNPKKDLIARTIRMSFSSPDGEPSYADYQLTLLDTYGVFDKYKVEGVTVKADSVRYYEIVQLTRMWDASIDEPLDNDNTISQVACKVAQQWTVYTIDGQMYYTMDEVETIQITSEFAGFLSYPQNSFNWSLEYESFDVHYLAFSTDKQIDKILEVEIEYKSQDYMFDSLYSFNYTDSNCFKDIKTNRVVLTADSDIVLSGSGWFSCQYGWNAIECIDDFMESEHLTYAYEYGLFDHYVKTELTDEAKNSLAEKAWVVRYAVTERGSWENGKGDWTKRWHTIVSDTTVMRIKFDMNGEIYNLGVVDNYQSEGRLPSNKVSVSYKPTNLIWLVICLLLLILLAPYLNPILTFVFKIFEKILSFIGKIVFAPFKLIKKIFKKPPN